MQLNWRTIFSFLMSVKFRCVQIEEFVYVVSFIGFTYLLSLHQVGSKTDCVMCFGPMVPDGYGVCYNPMEEHINVAITAFNSCEETNAARFAQAVEGALLDMRGLLEGAATPAEQ